MNPISSLRKIVDALDAPVEPAEPGYRTIRVRSDVYEALMVWKQQWSDKTASDALERVLKIAKSELLILSEDPTDNKTVL